MSGKKTAVDRFSSERSKTVILGMKISNGFLFQSRIILKNSDYSHLQLNGISGNLLN